MKCKIFDDVVYEKRVLHRYYLTLDAMINLKDSVGHGISTRKVNEWKQTRAGKYCEQHAREIEVEWQTNYTTQSVDFLITGYVTDKDWTYLSLIKD